MARTATRGETPDSETLELFPPEGTDSRRQVEDGGAPATAHARHNRRRAILDYFTQRPGHRISSVELHRMFGPAFRSRVSEINRDPAASLRICNRTTAGASGEVSHYWAEARGVEAQTPPGNGGAVGRAGERAGTEAQNPRQVQLSPKPGSHAGGRSRARGLADAKLAHRGRARRGSGADVDLADSALGVLEATAVDWPSVAYTGLTLDGAHQAASLQKYAEYALAVNRAGDALCPVCQAAMLTAPERPGLAPHHICPRSALVFYGDAEGLALCLHPAADVGGQVA